MSLIDSVLGSVAGSAVGGLFNMFGQSSANAANAALSQDYMGWYTQMSNTAHQREVADLEAAGLNPILSATGGSGASSSTITPPTMQNTMAGLGSSAQAIGRAYAEISNLSADTDAKSADALEKTERARLDQQQVQLSNEQADLARRNSDIAVEKLKQERMSTDLQRSLLPHQIYSGVAAARALADRSSAESAASSTEADIDNTIYGRVMRYIMRAIPFGNSAAQVVKSIK